MQHNISQFLLLIFVFIIPLYLYTFYRLYALVKVEHPEWFKTKGTIGYFTNGISNPNTQIELLKIIFTSKANKLKTALAISYAKRLRILIPLLFVLFIFGVALITP